MSIAAAVVLVVLTACDDPVTPANGDPSADSADVGSPDPSLVSNAALNAPVAGSVTQGSRATGGITADVVSWQSGGGVMVAGRSLPHLISGGLDRGSGLRYYTNRQETGLAAVASRILHRPGVAPRAAFFEGDPVAFGLWMYRTGSDLVWGAFADGLAAREVPSAAGTFGGVTIGVYADARGEVEIFVARVTLEVVEGSVAGTVDEILDIDGEPVTNPLGRGKPGDVPTVVLDAAATAGELARGRTALVIGGEQQRGWNGRWGVTFFQDGAAAGTWGVTDGFTFSVVGAFGAR